MPTPVQHRSAVASATSVVLAYASNNAAGNLLLYATGAQTVSGAITAATDNNSNTINNVETASNSSGGEIRVDKVDSCNAGANTVTAHDATASRMHLHIWEISGLTATPLDQTGSGSTNSSLNMSISTSGATSQASEVVFGVFYDYTNDDPLSAGTGFSPSEFSDGGTSNESMLSEYMTVSSTGVQSATATCTAGASNISYGVSTYKASGGSSVPATPSQFAMFGPPGSAGPRPAVFKFKGFQSAGRATINNSVTPTDTLSFSEALARLVASARSLTDTATFSETLARALSLLRSLTDTLSFSDTPARTVASPRSLTDTLSFSEALSRIVAHPRSLTDTASFSETLARALSLTRTVTDTLSFSETLARLVAQARTIIDTLSFSDSALGGRGVQRTATDTVTFSESIARALTLNRTFSDTLSFSEALARTTTAARAVIDTLSFSEALSRVRGSTRTAIDTLSASDAATRAPQALSRLVNDAYSAADTLARAVSVVRVISDTLGESDSSSGSANTGHGHSVSATDTLAFSESVTRVVTFVRILQDTAKVLEGANMGPKESAQLWEQAQNVIKESALDSLVSGAIWSAGQGVNSNNSAASAWQSAQPIVPRRELD